MLNAIRNYSMKNQITPRLSWEYSVINPKLRNGNKFQEHLVLHVCEWWSEIWRWLERRKTRNCVNYIEYILMHQILDWMRRVFIIGMIQNGKTEMLRICIFCRKIMKRRNFGLYEGEMRVNDFVLIILLCWFGWFSIDHSSDSIVLI